jgi:exopolyphosphatase/guanosine-5'-triphosphate,3'-diphosphate pyrophosphatase
VGEYREAIDALHADTVVGVATSAVRDSENGDVLRDDLRERFGVDLRTISGDSEALLTFSGASAGKPAAGQTTVVVDIGGGSTEFVVGQPGGEPTFHVSTRMGSVRHTERHLAHDPPSGDELRALTRDVDEILTAEIPAEVRADVEHAIAVAGTATSLGAIDLRLEPYDPDRVQGHQLSLAACDAALAALAEVPLEERRRVTGLHPDRAPTIVAGVAILVRSLRAFGLERVEISEADVLHGAALAAAEGRLPTG